MIYIKLINKTTKRRLDFERLNNNNGGGKMLNTSYLKAEDIERFREYYPAAFNYLLDKSLLNERTILEKAEKQGTLTEWQSRRLTEFKTIGI